MDLHTITYIMTLTLFLAALLGLSLVNKLPKPFVLIVGQLVLGSLAEIIGFTIKFANGANNSKVFNLYILLEFILLITGIIWWTDNKRIKYLLAGTLIVYIVAWIVNMHLNSINFFAANIFLLGCIILTPSYIYLCIRLAAGREHIIKEPLFWISLGVIIYFGSVVPLFSMFQYFGTHGKVRLGSYLYTINDILGIIRYSFIIYGLSLYKRSKPVLR